MRWNSFGVPCPHRNSDYGIRSNFWNFYLIRTSFTLSEPVSLVKVFRLFRLEPIVLMFKSVDTEGRCTTSSLLEGPGCLWCLVCCCKLVAGSHAPECRVGLDALHTTKGKLRAHVACNCHPPCPLVSRHHLSTCETNNA